MQGMMIDPNLMMWLFIAMFVVAIIAMILAALQFKGRKKIERGDIIRKILKERTKSLKLNKAPGVKEVMYTGGSKEIKRKPGNVIGKYLGSIEWEFLTEILVSRHLKKYYLIVPNEYLTDPNRKIYPIRARGITFHTWAWVPVVENAEEQNRIFDLTDRFLDLLIKTWMRYENKESEFRVSLEASNAPMSRVPYYAITRKEEVGEDEETK